MKELRVEDALLYLDQVKVEFGDRPHIYNEFLDIMKTFKTQQIDTPGVIRRVSNLFQGNRKLVLGFNTFLPEGYKIELPPDGDGPPVAVYRAPGSNVAHVLRESAESQAVSVTAAAAALDPSRGGNEGAPIQRVDPRGITGPPPPRPQPPPLGRPILPMDAGGVVARGPMGVPLEVARQSQQPAPRHLPGGVAPRQPAPRGLGGPPQAVQPTGMQPQQAFPPQHQQPLPATQQQQPPQQQQPLEFDHAINYVTTIKRRFASEPETYKKFLEILHTYQKEQRGIKEVLDEVSELFEDHPDLLKEFTYFLPDAVQAQAKAQLDVAAKAAEQRKRNKAKAAIMSTAQGMRSRQQQQTPAARAESAPVGSPFVPGLQQQRSTMEREANLARMAQFGVVSFSPMRPPRKNELTAAQAAVKFGRPTHIPALPYQPRTTEAAFFEKVKVHLQRRELAADKPTGSRRHTPHVEFLKCLHLFGAGILNRDELLLLLKGLFMQGHAPKSGAYASGASQNPEVAADAQALLREFEELMIRRGPYANQESSLKDRSSYGALRVRDFDFTNCDNPTPSYRTYPDDYPDLIFLSHPGQSEEDASVLNNELVCVDPNIVENVERDGPRKRSRETRKRLAPGIEESDGARKRHNCYEDVLFRIEDERFEMDMAIERNVHALRRIENMAKEVQTLREQEEKDGQPIGRLRYQLKRHSLNSTHINAIGRVYGERGDEILQHLLRNPYIVLPVVYQRLKQKEAEWRKAKSELIEVWNSVCEDNYEGSLDVQCYFNRKALEKLFARSKLLHQCQHSKSFTKHPEKSSDEAVTRPFSPVFGKSVPDAGAVFYQPYVELDCKIDDSHKYAIQLITHVIKTSTSVSLFNRARIGRIWAEFMVPWFQYPPYWVIDEVRESFSGKLGPSVTKFISGQKVMTIFGEGSIASLIDSSTELGPRYRVKLPFGLCFLSPSAILYALPSRETPYIRRDGVMVHEESPFEVEESSKQLDSKYQLLFGTEHIYLFLRLYSLLCSILADTKAHCDSFPVLEDPVFSYISPKNRQSDKKCSPVLNFSSIMGAFRSVVSNEISPRDFEALGRKVAKAKVHQIAALPKLVERCVHALVKVAEEDTLLQLYDFCHFENLDPVLCRKQCLSIVPDAEYRIQFDRSAERIFFGYLPRDQKLQVFLHDDDADEEMEEDTAGETGDEPMEEDIEEINELNGGPSDAPSAKRLKT